MSEIEFRSAQVVGVSYPKRQIELIVMPYETEAVVDYHGRPITEICSRGAYDGIERRPGRVAVNRDHVVERTCGKALAFHPSREEGLVAEIRISNTDLGTETLELANDGVLGASAGFGLWRDKDTHRVVANAEVWESRNRRRLNHLYLDHVALTPRPAYVTADVLAVRQDDGAVLQAMPNRDRLELDQLRALYADIDRRYSVAQH
jgi:phage head maturation protease